MELSDQFVLSKWSSARVAEMISEVSVGFPDGGIFDLVDHFMKTIPGYVEAGESNSSLALSLGFESILILSPRKRLTSRARFFP